jgi:uncharacterized membrane protein
MTTALALLLIVGAGAVGGVFFAFSSFVMRALAELSPAQGIRAMQSINVVVLNPVFPGVFVGTAILGLGVAAFMLVASGAPGAGWLLAAAILYGLGCFGVTLRCNMPRNERLVRLAAESADAADYWPEYVREWTRWNQVRTCASLAAAACAGAALAAT